MSSHRKRTIFELLADSVDAKSVSHGRVELHRLERHDGAVVGPQLLNVAQRVQTRGELHYHLHVRIHSRALTCQKCLGGLVDLSTLIF